MALKFPARFDSHCHLFNLKYLSLEASNMLLDVILGRYPIGGGDGADHGRIQDVTLKGNIVDFFGWLKSLEKGLLGNEEEHLDTVLAAGSRAWNDRLPVAAIPLMMDIYYMLAPVLLPGAPKPVLAKFRQSSFVSGARFAKALVQVEDHLKSLGLGDEMVNFVRLGMQGGRSKGLGAGSAQYHQTQGFSYHRQKLEALKSRRPDAMFPFFAVDPRRPGVVQAVISGNFVGKGRTFQGVKLYPRLGYHPACEALEPLFDWCAKRRIPVVSHCAAVGFPPVGGHDQLGHPSSFAPVLDRHPDLILDFAHFGFGETSWADAIAALMERYDNVYSDLACFTKASQIAAIKGGYFGRSRVRERTMFGTDFDMFYLVSVGSTMDNYYQSFGNLAEGGFTREELLAMSSTVPQKFLATVV